MLLWIELALFPMILISSILAIREKDLVTSIILLGVVSLMVSVEMFLLNAPDVAMSEAAVGGALTVAIYLLAITITERYEVEE